MAKEKFESQDKDKPVIINTNLELHQKKPRGYVRFTDTFNRKWDMFICYGCQSCWYMTDGGGTEESYPHILNAKEII